MAGTNKERFDNAIKYIQDNISRELALDLKVQAMNSEILGDQIKLPEEKVVGLGAQLSLKGTGAWHTGNTSAHMALRALLLCQKVYLNAPYSLSNMGTAWSYNQAPSTTIPYYLSKPETVIKDAIRCYMPLDSATKASLLNVAQNSELSTGTLFFETVSRDTFKISTPTPVCFDAVRMWLFKAGFVSLRWLARKGPLMTAQTANSILGDGAVVRSVDDIPAGNLFNFHRDTEKAICHWGISLGNGMAVGCNTTAAEGGARVHFSKGDSKYGEFSMQESLEVCEYKYKIDRNTGHGLSEIIRETGKAPVTIRSIDPTQPSQAYF